MLICNLDEEITAIDKVDRLQTAVHIVNVNISIMKLIYSFCKFIEYLFKKFLKQAKLIILFYFLSLLNNVFCRVKAEHNCK
jgi:hypothetical protein